MTFRRYVLSLRIFPLSGHLVDKTSGFRLQETDIDRRLDHQASPLNTSQKDFVKVNDAKATWSKRELTDKLF